MESVARIFLLSPATLGGVRGRRILAGRAEAAFMGRLEGGGGVPLGEIYAYISSLYYRGKRVYAARFGRRSDGPAALVITPARGLLPDEGEVDMRDLEAFANTEIDPSNPAFLDPLLATARSLEAEIHPRARIILLGSIASDKYLKPLGSVFGRRLLVPRAFVGRGDMSRGGLLLRAAAAGEELDYVLALETPRRGARPPRPER